MQHRALYRAGCRELFTDEGVSGAIFKRPALTRCLKKLQRGDTLSVVINRECHFGVFRQSLDLRTFGGVPSTNSRSFQWNQIGIKKNPQTSEGAARGVG